MDSQLNRLSREYRQAETEEDRKEIRFEAQRRTIDHHFTPKALIEWKAEAFALWCVTYIPHLIPEVEDWQVPSLDDVFTHERVLIMWPAQMGKTTMLSIALPLFREVGNPNLEGLGVFKDDDDAKSALKTIKDEASENEKLIEDYGQLKPSPGDRTHKWTQHRIDFAQRTRRSKQSSIMYFPYGAAVLGKRSHWRFADDIVTRKIAMSQALNRQQVQWFQVDFESGPYSPQDKASYIEGHSQIYVQMTRMTPEDLGNHLEHRVTEDEARRNPHIRTFKTRVVDLLDEANRRTITPRYTWDQAKALEAEMGAEAFAMRMRNLIVTDKTAKFKRVFFDGGEYNSVMYPGCWNKNVSYDDAISKDMRVTIGYDPQSGSTSRQAAEAGLVMLGNKADGKWKPRLLDYYRGQAEVVGDKDPDAQISRILRMAARCNKVGITPRVCLEGNNIQRSLRRSIIEAAERQDPQVILSVNIDYTGENKWHPETGLEASKVDFENGWLEIPGMYASDQAMFKGFVDSMTAYGVSAFSDVPIAYWKARQYLYDHRGQNQTQHQLITLTDKTPPRIARRMRRLGMLDGLVIRDAYGYQEEEAVNGQRVG